MEKSLSLQSDSLHFSGTNFQRSGLLSPGEAPPHSKAKPAGVHGCEIWMKLGGEAPKESTELTYVATDTRTPYTVVFTGADAGKTAWYWLRWVNNRGENGPWGCPISAMVAG